METWYGLVFTMTLAINAPLLARAIWYTTSAIKNEGLARRLEAETAFIRAHIDQELAERELSDTSPEVCGSPPESTPCSEQEEVPIH